MGLRPVIKARGSRQRVAGWIVERFPEAYREMTYVEPFLGDGSVLLSKDESKEEVASDSDGSLMSVWRAIRDEHSAFSSRVKRMKHSKATFQRCSKASGGDYMEEAIREFVLRQMSKGAGKKSYLCRLNEERCSDCWCGIFDRIPEVHERVKGVFMMGRCALEVLKAFDHGECLTFCDPPDLDPSNSDFHSALGDVLAGFRGKALIVARNSAMYRRMYASWNRKGVPGSKTDSLWTNF
jgi:DNA adenine methylase